MNNKKILLILLCFVFCSVTSNADMIPTSIFLNGNALQEENLHLRIIERDKIPTITMPEVNVESLISEDEELDARGVGRPYRFGAKIHTNIRMADGQ